MTIRARGQSDVSVRLPADLPAIDEVGLRRPPAGAPEELRVGVEREGAAVLRPGADVAYPLALPPPPPAPRAPLTHLRDAVERLAFDPAADVLSRSALPAALAAALDPLLSAERALAAQLSRLVALRELVDSARRTAIGEPR